MAASSALSALRVPGTLSFDTVGNPGPGTTLGMVRGVQLRRVEGRSPIVMEEFGIEVAGDVYLGETWRMAFALRGWDADAIPLVFKNVQAGPEVQWPGTTHVPGRFTAQDSIRLQFTPLETSHNPVVFESAIPEAVEELGVDLGHRVEHLILCTFLALREGVSPAGSVKWGP